MPSPAALADDDMVGNRYRLTRLVARGGMAEVWEAEDTVLGRPVAVKALHPHLAADDAFLERFRREAVAAARLSHPHIVAIYDTCAGDGCEAIVMELVRGRTLRDLLDEKGTLAPQRAAAIAADVADALHHAHRAGLVHRDIKPGNILLADDGRVLVTDFGIAKAAETASDLTEVGQVVGTAKYLAPEQVESGPIDARTDVYALGVVLYEMLCGRPPFEGETSTATALARLHSVPLRPRQVRAGIPKSLEDVVLRAMARDAAARYDTAAAMQLALQDAAVGADETDAGDATEAVSLAPAPPADPTATIEAVANFARAERTWLVPAALILIVALTLGVVGVVLGGTEVGQDLFDAVGGDDSPSADGSTLTPTLAAFDPNGNDQEENDHLLPLALDGDASTAWETDQYRSPVAILKGGVGITLVVPAQALDSLVITSATRGWRAEIYVADEPAADLAGWGEPVATAGGDGGPVTVDLDGVEAGAVLIWITDLGDGLQFQLQEVKLVG